MRKNVDMKKALITGITGQDGSYLAEFLLEKGYEIHGIVRRTALEDPEQRLRRIHHINEKIILHPGSIENYASVFDIFEKVKPDECYHLAAQSFVKESFEDAHSTFNININGVLHVLSAIKQKTPNCKFYFAGSSEMFGNAQNIPQTEDTKFYPRSPYGVSKVTGFDLTRSYRESYNLFACSGIAFNHESPRRGFEFVTRKISSTIAKIKQGKTNILVLGNLDAKRDWGFAGDYVEVMWLMLQQEKPDDFVISTGENHSVQEFIDLAFKHAGIKYELIDLSNLSEEEADKKIDWFKKQKDKIFVVQHPKFYRPAEVHELLGDASKARRILKWKPKISFNELVKMMVDEDIKLAKSN